MVPLAPDNGNGQTFPINRDARQNSDLEINVISRPLLAIDR